MISNCNYFDLISLRLLDNYGFISVDDNPNLIQAFVAGENMKSFENFSDSKIIDDCMWILEKFLKKTLKRPINMTRTKWLTNENFLGSYSYLSIASDSNSNERLGQPIFDESGKPVILFGGEATDTRFSGYVHGAWRSGNRVAQDLISFNSSEAAKNAAVSVST